MEGRREGEREREEGRMEGSGRRGLGRWFNGLPCKGEEENSDSQDSSSDQACLITFLYCQCVEGRDKEPLGQGG